VSPLAAKARRPAFKYFLVCRPEAAQWRKVICFSEWLIGEVKIAAGQQAVCRGLTGVVVDALHGPPSDRPWRAWWLIE